MELHVHDVWELVCYVRDPERIATGATSTGSLPEAGASSSAPPDPLRACTAPLPSTPCRKKCPRRRSQCSDGAVFIWAAEGYVDMLTGSIASFAIEAEPREAQGEWIWGGFRFWLGGRPVGDWEDAAALQYCLSWLRGFLEEPPDNTEPSMARLPAKVTFETLYDSAMAGPTDEGPVRDEFPDAVPRFHITHLGMSSFDPYPIIMVKDELGNERCLWRKDGSSEVFEQWLAPGEFEHVLREFCERFEREWMRVDLQVQDVCKIVRDVCAGERTAAEAHGATLELGAGLDHLLVRVDGPKLHQIVLNLVRHAIEAVTAGGHVRVAVTRDDEGFAVQVEDDGPGMPEEAREWLHEPFASIHESGPGLSIAHTLVALHAGRIDMTSTSPSGTVLTVRVPWRDGA